MAVPVHNLLALFLSPVLVILPSGEATPSAVEGIGVTAESCRVGSLGVEIGARL